MGPLAQTILYTAGTLLAGTAVSWIFIVMEKKSKKSDK